MDNPYAHTCDHSPEPCLGCIWDDLDREWEAKESPMSLKAPAPPRSVLQRVAKTTLRLSGVCWCVALSWWWVLYGDLPGGLHCLYGHGAVCLVRSLTIQTAGWLDYPPALCWLAGMLLLVGAVLEAAAPYWQKLYVTHGEG